MSSDRTSTQAEGSLDVNQRLITADSHSAVPPALADELPPAMRAKVPHFEERSDGMYLVRPLPGIADMQGRVDQGDMMTQSLAAGVKVDPDDDVRVAEVLYGDVAVGCHPSFTAEGRLAEMARDGVVAEVLVDSAQMGILSDPEVGQAWAQLTNDWAADSFGDHFDHFAVGINLPLFDVEAAVKELERATALGLGPLLLPDVFPDRAYSAPWWEPLWEAAAGLHVPVLLHVSGGRAPKQSAGVKSSDFFFGSRDLVSGLTLISVGCAETISWFVMGGVLERHPDLQVALTEGGAGWLAWLMGYLDFHHTQRWSSNEGIMRMMGFQDPRPMITELPSHYIRRQVKCSFIYDPVAIAMRDYTGTDCLIWGNDYPHIEGVFPDSQQAVDDQFAGIPDDEIVAMVHDNAAALYGLDQTRVASTG
jgi:predicted TIM-barrel fold metal-dependent hydrolase